MVDQFYYADANSNPVGPLSLDEIRRFADAGVVPPDVMVCEAGGEDWKPLSSFAPLPRAAPPPKSAPPPKASRLDQSGEEKAQRLDLHLNHAVLVMALSFGASLATSVGLSGDERTGSNDSPFDLVAALGLWATAAEVILIYKICSTLPPHLRFATPGKAAGFTLIPGFHLYWAFRLLPGLAEGTLRLDREFPDATRKPVPSWLGPLAYVNAILVAITTALVLIEMISGVPVGLGGQIFYGILCAGLIVFYSDVVGALRRILIPGEAARQPTESWGSMIWAGLIALPVIVRVIKSIIEKN